MMEEFIERLQTWLASIGEDLRALRAETNLMREETAALHRETSAMLNEMHKLMQNMNNLMSRIEMLHGLEPTEASQDELTDDDTAGWKM